jgi:hypothetical protein
VVKRSWVIGWKLNLFVWNVSVWVKQEESQRIISSESQEWMKGPIISVADAKIGCKI